MTNTMITAKLFFIAIFSVFIFSCGDGTTDRTDTTTRTDTVDRDGGLFDREDRRTITITATDFEFNPNQITARPGEKLEIQLVNRGQASHNIEVELGENIVGGTKDRSMMTNVSPGETGTINITAPDEPGTYTFYCPVDDHGSSMRGTLTVR